MAYVDSADLAGTGVGQGAAMVGFKQSGTGAEGRTVLEKGRDVVSLLDFIPSAQHAAIAAGTSTYDISTAWANAMLRIASYTSTYNVASAGKLVIPPGVYYVSSPLTIENDDLGGLCIDGYGATLKPAGAIPVFRCGGATAQCAARIKIQGLTIDVRGNASVVAGIQFNGGMSWAMIRDVYILADATTNAGFAGVQLKQEDPTDADTAQFWVTIDNLTSAFAGIGVDLQGAQNNTRIINSSFNNNATGVRLYNQGATGVATPNSVLILGSAFEGGTTAIKAETDNAAIGITGLRIIGCRGEQLTNFLDLSDITTDVLRVPSYLTGNYLDSSVTNYIVNPNGLKYVSLDASQNPNNTAANWYNSNPLRFEAFSGRHAITVSGNGKGIELVNGTTPCGSITTRSGGGMVIEGGSSNPAVEIRTVKAISASTTQSKNFYHPAVFSASTSATVTFNVSLPEPDVNYSVLCISNDGKSFWVTDANRSTTGFTVTASATHTGTVRCFVFRYG